VCALSTKKFNEALQKHPEIVLLVVSADLPFAQKRFCGLENLSQVIPLSMMRNKDFAKSYGVLIEEGPLAGLAARALIVLDEKDRLLYAELVPEIATEPNYDKALEAAFCV
jgi:thiol peroxidase